MIDSGVGTDDSWVSRSGGLPLAPPGFVWPLCATCGGPLQFLVQLLPADVPALDHLLLIFMCQNDPGICDEWEPFAGGNRPTWSRNPTSHRPSAQRWARRA